MKQKFDNLRKKIFGQRRRRRREKEEEENICLAEGMMRRKWRKTLGKG